MADKTHSRVLLVEGKEDLRVIPELIEANGINWGKRTNPIVYIKEFDGYDQLVDPDVIQVELQASQLTNLGIIIDADAHPQERWQSIRNACLQSIPDIPEVLPETGLIHVTPNHVKFGIWIMPDNQMRGMIETFLAYLIPEITEPIWHFAQEVVAEAKNRGAEFTNAHIDKANIYTWLAWQSPPGRQLHQAIMERILNPSHPNAEKFVNWFKTLYNLP